METQTKIQKYPLGIAGSFHNQIMANNSSLPEVGKGATELRYTDRAVYDVIEVSKDGKTVKMEYLRAKADPSKNWQMGHQDWVFEKTNHFTTVVWRYGAWHKKINGKFHKTHILFGVKDYYYDWPF
jgi:hypothetical protein